MTGSELMAEYEKDLVDLQAHANRFLESDYMERMLRKHRKEKRVVLTRTITTSRYNRYIAVYLEELMGMGKSKTWYPSAFYVGLMESRKGLCALIFYERTRQAIRFSPHFFKRYKERLSEVGDWKVKAQLRASKTLIEIIATYVRRNLYMSWVEAEGEFPYEGKVPIFSPVADGIALLEWIKDKDLLQANTFITRDMLNEEQCEMARYADIYLSLSEDERKLIEPPEFTINNP